MTSNIEDASSDVSFSVLNWRGEANLLARLRKKSSVLSVHTAMVTLFDLFKRAEKWKEETAKKDDNFVEDNSDITLIA